MNSPKSANKLLLFFLIYSILMQFVVASFASVLENIDMLLLLFLQDVFLILLPIIMYLLVTKRKITELVPLHLLDFKNIIYVILITVFTYPIMSCVSYISQIFVSTAANDTITEYMNNYSTAACLLGFALIPAVFEEVFCRGVIQSNYKTASPIVMYLMSGIAFGIIHMNFQQMSYAIVAGIMLAFLVHQTNSILASVLSHFIINGSQVVVFKALSPLLDNIEETADVSSSTIFTNPRDILLEVLYLCFMSGICLVILSYIVKKFKAHNKERAERYLNNESGTQTRVVDKYLVAAILIFLVFCLLTEFLISMI